MSEPHKDLDRSKKTIVFNFRNFFNFPKFFYSFNFKKSYAGISNQNVDPSPGSLSTPISPFILVTISLLI